MKLHQLRLIINTVVGCLIMIPIAKSEFFWENYYDIVNIPTPQDVDSQIGGLAMNTKGELVACFHRGEVGIYNEETQTWRIFATGLHEPLGIYIEEEGTILVIQRGELTRLHDKNNDGVADFYELVSNDWGLSGNYHEFAFGLVKDSKKNIYISLGTASNGAGVRAEIKGEWNDAGGLTQQDFLSGGKYGDWKKKKKKVSRMYARVPYRGCILRIKPGSMKVEVYATGVRTPNGLYMDDNDQLWVSDNQGDWVGASKIHRIEEGGFHGHPASLLWTENPPIVTPAKMPVKELEAMRIKAPILLPQGDCANSITQMLPLTQEFAPVSKTNTEQDKLIVGEMNHSRIVKYLPDVVNGQHQGAVTHILNTASIGSGNNRLLYSLDGKSLYLGKTHLSWSGSKGIKKATYNGRPYLLVESVQLTSTGFKFTFNYPIQDQECLNACQIKSYEVLYHASYGSPKKNLMKETCTSMNIDDNVLTIDLAEKPRANRVYDITLPGTITSEISDLPYNRFWYTAHAVYD